jgi:hypothetical protein
VNDIGSLSGIKIILHRGTYTKTRKFKWSFKWWQRPFHLFKKYKIITAKRECYILKNGQIMRDMINNCIIMNPITFGLIKKESINLSSSENFKTILIMDV